MKMDTEERYSEVSRQLLKRFSKETGINWRSDPQVLINWLHQKSDEWMPATWRQYKSALIRHFVYYGTEDYIEMLRGLEKKPIKPDFRKSNRTSRQKQKRFSHDELTLIIEELTKRRTRYASILANWLYVGILTGVRPIEWHESEVILNENGCFLSVKNAKYSQRRSNGEFRTLELTSMASDEIGAIQKQVSLLSGIDQDEYTLMQKSCADLMYRVCRKLWPNKNKYPTLYSTRHQFSANAKKSRYDLKEVAALMGHAVEDTATLHYGKKRDGQDHVRVSPLASEVETVRDSKNGFLSQARKRWKHENESSDSQLD